VSLQHGVLPATRARSRPSSCAAMCMRKRGESGSATGFDAGTVWLRTGTYRSLPRVEVVGHKDAGISKGPSSCRPDEVLQAPTGPTLPIGRFGRPGSAAPGSRRSEGRGRAREERRLRSPRDRPNAAGASRSGRPPAPSPRRKGRPRRHRPFPARPGRDATRPADPSGTSGRSARAARRVLRVPLVAPFPPARRAFPSMFRRPNPPNRLPEEGPCTLRP